MSYSSQSIPLTPLQEESLTFQGQLDSLEAEILKHRAELHNMQIMNNDAQLSKEAAKVICSLLFYQPTTCMEWISRSPLLSSLMKHVK